MLPISNFSRIVETFSSGDGGEEEGEARQEEANGIIEAGAVRREARFRFIDFRPRATTDRDARQVAQRMPEFVWSH